MTLRALIVLALFLAPAGLATAAALDALPNPSEGLSDGCSLACNAVSLPPAVCRSAEDLAGDLAPGIGGPGDRVADLIQGIGGPGDSVARLIRSIGGPGDLVGMVC